MHNRQDVKHVFQKSPARCNTRVLHAAALLSSMGAAVRIVRELERSTSSELRQLLEVPPAALVGRFVVHHIRLARRANEANYLVRHKNRNAPWSHKDFSDFMRQ